MKRFGFLLVFLCAIVLWQVQAAAEEILFRGIPWDSNIIEVRDALQEEKFPALPIERNPDDDSSIYDFSPLNDAYWMYIENTVSVYNIDLNNLDIELAGHKIKRIELFFLNSIVSDDLIDGSDNALKFKRAEYWISPKDGAECFDDLKSKLTKLYGVPKESTEILSDELISDWAMWNGDNDTGVFIKRRWARNAKTHEYKMEIGFEVTYGKTDVLDEIKDIENVGHNEIKRKEKERLAGETDNYDGL